MLESVTVNRHIAPALTGGSKAQVFADESGSKYFVKYIENNQDVRILVNEYISAGIAIKLGLPIPKPFFIYLEEQMLPLLKSHKGLPISKGPHFGSTNVENLYEGPAIRSLITKCRNKYEYPGIILFDTWLFNNDRNKTGNYLIVVDNQDYDFSIIDHGHSMGMHWVESHLADFITLWPDNHLPEMYAIILSLDNFSNIITKIKSISDDFISTLVDGIPIEWLVNASEASALKTYLMNKRDGIESLLTENKSKFTNWI